MPISHNQSPSPAPLAARVLTIVFGITFAGARLAVLASLWSVTGFFEPPLFFKVVGSLIALPFVPPSASSSWLAAYNEGVAGMQSSSLWLPSRGRPVR